MLCVSPCATMISLAPSTAACALQPWTKPSLVRSTRLSGSVKLRCALGSGSFEGGRGAGPERSRFPVAIGTLWRFFKRRKITRKKSRRTPPNSAAAR